MKISEILNEIREAVSKVYEEATRCNPVRTRGPQPMMDDPTLISLEIIGEMQGFNGDRAIWKYLDWHWTDELPNLPAYKTFAQQSKKLHWVKNIILDRLFPVTQRVVNVDSLPLRIAKWPRVSKSKMLRDEADWGYNASTKEGYYGFKGHAVAQLDGIIGKFMVTPANEPDIRGLEILPSGFTGTALGDKAYLSKEHKERLAERGIDLQTPLRRNMKDDRPFEFRACMRRFRRRIESVFSVLVRKFSIAKIKAHTMDQYMSKLTRKILAYNFSVRLKKA